MAGIYVHIPFCKRFCHYCDFFKAKDNERFSEYLPALLKEIEVKNHFLNEPVETLYIGGGTPSILSISDLDKIVNSLHKNYSFNKNIEFTIEVNPNDVNLNYYKDLIKLGVNRLSIGIQSFNTDILKFLNRRHNNQHAHDSIKYAIDAGFNNISVDLIYGIPSQTMLDFISDLSTVARYRIPHLSAYHLGIEENTHFGELLKQARLSEIDESLSELFYDTLIEWADDEFYEQYEISNFARDEKYSKHNKNYWFHVPYLSFGPSAHSYINGERGQNISDLNIYIDNLSKGKDIYSIDKMDDLNKFNEFIMTRLRTQWGLNLNEVMEKFGEMYYFHLLTQFSKFEDSTYIRNENGTLKLTSEGFFISDFMFKELFIPC